MSGPTPTAPNRLQMSSLIHCSGPTSEITSTRLSNATTQPLTERYLMEVRSFNSPSPPLPRFYRAATGSRMRHSWPGSVRRLPRREILTPSQRVLLLAFPNDEGELIRRYTLTKADLAFVRQRRGDHNRLGIAVQMRSLRFPGWVPE